MKRFSLLTSLALLFTTSTAFGLSIDSKAPGNTFPEGVPIEFSVKDTQGDASYELVDFYGKQMANGTAKAAGGQYKIAIPAQRPCWYELKCKDEKSSDTVSLAVVIDRGKKPLPIDGRIGAVSCSAWLIKKEEQRKPYARMLGLAGLSWVREPLAWEQTEKEPGKFDWGVYQTVEDQLHGQGIHINLGWTSVPAWSHPSNPGQPYPDDLRALYRYLKTAAAHFKDHAAVWDVLNEVELTWPITSDTCAAMQKVSYLGIKAGNPNARVLQASYTHLTPQGICDWGRSAFVEGMYECGVGDYFDIFNHHSYLPAWTYPRDLESARQIMEKYGITGKAAWITEAGLGYNGTDGPKEHYMNSYSQSQQCRLVPMSATMALVAGNEKYFWFVIPDYIENGNVQFALLRPDLSPNPSFAALSAAANILGESDYLGDYNPNGKKSVSYLFSTPKGNVLVAWADTETELSVPTEKATVDVADMFGARKTVKSERGTVKVKVAREAVYLIDVGSRITKNIKPAPADTRLDAIKPLTKPSTVVLIGRADLPMDKAFNGYKLSTGGIGTVQAPFTYTIDVYQFDEAEGANGTVELAAPEGWTVENPKRTLKLAPMDRQTLTFKISPVPNFLGVNKLVVRGVFNGKPTAPASSYVKYDFNAYGF